MIYNKKELTKYMKTKIVNKDKEGLTQFQISRNLMVSTSLIDWYLHKYKTSKIIDWNKKCWLCWDWFENNVKYFPPNWYACLDWSPSLRRDCRTCRSIMRKKERKLKPISVVKTNLKTKVKRRVTRIIFWNTRWNSMSEEARAEYYKKRQQKVELNKKIKLKLQTWQR